MEDVREYWSDNEINLVALDETLDLLYGNVGLSLVINDDDLDVARRYPTAKLVDGEDEPVAGLLTDDSRGA